MKVSSNIGRKNRLENKGRYKKVKGYIKGGQAGNFTLKKSGLVGRSNFYKKNKTKWFRRKRWNFWFHKRVTSLFTRGYGFVRGAGKQKFFKFYLKFLKYSLRYYMGLRLPFTVNTPYIFNLRSLLYALRNSVQSQYIRISKTRLNQIHARFKRMFRYCRAPAVVFRRLAGWFFLTRKKRIVNNLRNAVISYGIGKKVRSKFLGNKLRLSFFSLASYFVYKDCIRSISRILRIDLQNFLGSPVCIKAFFLSRQQITPQVVVRYLLRKMERLYLPGEIIPRIISQFEGTPRKNIFRVRQSALKRVSGSVGAFGSALKGMFFNCKGRFTRAQMASHLRFQGGSMPLSAISKDIKYAFDTISLKYGSLGLKVYFNYGLIKRRA